MKKVCESYVKVRYQETDQMKIVYHANYLVWFEIGRTEFIRELGMSYSELEQHGLLLPVLEANCTYRKPAKYEDELIILTSVLELKGARLTFHYQVVRDGEILAEGFTRHAFTSPELRPVNLRSAMPDLYEKLAESVE